MTTDRLIEFSVLANVLNYSRASEKLFISQSILSRHIKELEEETGCKLFERNTHGVSLTNEGKFFLKWIQPLLSQTDNLIASLKKNAPPAEGSIQILSSEQSLTTEVLAFMRSFIQDHPDVALSVHPLMGASEKRMLYSQDIFLTPCDFTDTQRQDVKSVMLKYQQPLLAIPPYHHFGDHTEIHLESLKGEKLILPFADEMFGPYARNFMVAERKCHGQLSRIPVDNPQEGLLRVEFGEGVMLIPHHLKDRIYPKTRTIPVQDNDCLFPIYIYLNKANTNPIAELFFNTIKKAFSDETFSE